MSTFKEIGISEWLTKQLNGLNLTKPTAVQVFIISLILNLNFSFRILVFLRFWKGMMYLVVQKLEQGRH